MTAQSQVDLIDFSSLSSLSNEQMQQYLIDHQLSLSVAEARAVQHILGRMPTLAELVLWSIQGSEHCSYRSSRVHLKKMITDGPNVILGAKEDAGIVALATDKMGVRYGVVVSHESHNHPSQLVPYEGAATGVGGNIRDVCCMGAEVIAIADSLRFGDLAAAKTHWIQQGVVAGIAGYGNPVGVPTIAGDVYFDAGYNDNCLVTVVTLGIVREDEIIHSYAPAVAKEANNEYVFILVGKPTDQSGFGGASFASMDLDVTKEESQRGAVQEPNAFLERHLLKANYALFQKIHARGLTQQVGFKDLGAGGIACASVELADAGGFGADIDLDAVPVSMANLPPHVVLCAETQERFMWIVPHHLADEICAHYNEEFALPTVSFGACAKVIGTLRRDGYYRVRSQGQDIVYARAADVTKGIVQTREFHPPARVPCEEPTLSSPENFNEILLQLLAHENIASRDMIFEKYDKQVQGRTILEAGLADAGILQPFNDAQYPAEIRQVGVALSLDHSPRYSRIDPYWGAVNAVVEAARNVTAVGATPIAITDCLCFGNPEKPAQMWEFVEAVRGIVDACRAIGLKDFPDASLPVIAGNVSFYNESTHGAIPPSPMISCLGSVADVKKVVTRDFKATDSLLLLTTPRADECGGSIYYALFNTLGANVPKPDLASIGNELRAVQEAMAENCVLAAHDISEGGLAIALAEMSFTNHIGVDVQLPGELANEKKLFSETGGFILEVAPAQLKKIKSIFAKHHSAFSVIGRTTAKKQLNMQDCVMLDIAVAAQAHQQGLRKKCV